MTRSKKKEHLHEKGKQLNISKLDEDSYTSFKDICKTKHISSKELFNDMLQTYKAGEKMLTARERKLINEAIEASGVDGEAFRKIALLEKSHRILRQKQRALKMGEEYVGKSKGADLKATQLLEQIFENNNAAKNKFDKIYINSTSLVKFSNNSLNQDVIKRCLFTHEEKINAHHQQHDLHVNHNRDCALRLKLQRKQEKAKQLKIQGKEKTAG